MVSLYSVTKARKKRLRVRSNLWSNAEHEMIEAVDRWLDWPRDLLSPFLPVRFILAMVHRHQLLCQLRSSSRMASFSEGFIGFLLFPLLIRLLLCSFSTSLQTYYVELHLLLLSTVMINVPSFWPRLSSSSSSPFVYAWGAHSHVDRRMCGFFDPNQMVDRLWT